MKKRKSLAQIYRELVEREKQEKREYQEDLALLGLQGYKETNIDQTLFEASTNLLKSLREKTSEELTKLESQKKYFADLNKKKPNKKLALAVELLLRDNDDRG